MSAASVALSALRPADILPVGSIGLRTRKLRGALSALGIAIGIASMVAVLGISASSKADLLATLDRLGTNLLAVKPGQSFFGEETTLPTSATPMIGRIDRVGRGVQVWLDDRWYTVVGILEPITLAPELDSYALVGLPYAKARLGADSSASLVYVRTDPDSVERVHSLLGATASPEHPEEVDVSRPSDALQARAEAKTAFTSLFLGLGAVALLVGGVWIANVLVVSVLERRSEIGLRRALGATKRHIALQFLTESVLLGAMGGAAGAALGALVTAGYDQNRGWALVG